MDIQQARARAAALFNDLGDAANCDLIEVGRREGEGLDFGAQITLMTPSGFPIPSLLHFGLTQLLCLEDAGPEEKVRWSVAFGFRGATYAFELRKFGLRLLCEPHNLDTPLTREVLGKARALTDLVEAHLSEFVAAQQLASGNFTIENLFHRLDDRYSILRDQALNAYATPPPAPVTEQGPNRGWTSYDFDKPRREGAAFATAAVDAYFSRIEHTFCLCAAFLPQAVRGDEFLTFLAENWPAKARRLLNLADPVAKRFYDRLLEIRDEWRNPLAHGGFLSSGGSLHFHVPGIGALPARLCRTPHGVRVGFRLPHESFEELVTLFDEYDAFLSDGPLRLPLRWAKSGLDVSFDAKNRKRLASAMEDEETFDDFIDGCAEAHDRYMNMD